MAALTVLLAALVYVLFWSRSIHWIYRVRFGADACIYTDTDDGWRLALWRYRARGPRKAHPVILCPGLGSNRYSFDLGPDAPSLARTLAENGFDVFVPELRGHGASDDGPSFSGWSFMDYVEHDAPAFIETVLRETGARRVHWVGHSMGGIILLTLLCRGGAHIRSAVTIGSALDYRSAKGFQLGLPLRPLWRRLPALPVGLPYHLFAPLAARMANPVERFNMWVDNVEPVAARRLNAKTFNRCSSSVLEQLSTSLEPGGLKPPDGGPPYIEQLAAQPALPPLMMMAGDRDEQCHPDGIDATAAGHPEIVVRYVGRDRGHDEHYGHFDMLMGKRVETEVFPDIVGFLSKHDAKREAGAVGAVSPPP